MKALPTTEVHGTTKPIIQSHRWQTKRIRFLLQRRAKNDRGRQTNGFREVNFVPMEAVGKQGEIDLSILRDVADVEAGYTRFFEGDVLVAKITPCFENGKGALVKDLISGVGFGTTELHVLTPNPEVDRHFLYYVSVGDHFRKMGEADMKGAAGQKRVPEDFILNYRIALPSINEQFFIASYVDRETSRIDALIAAKEQLLDLLAEKRRALITQAVTKGLNPNAPMRDSGLPWLGEIPRHWEIVRLKFVLSKIGSGKTPSGGAEACVPEGIPLIRSQNVQTSGLSMDDVVFIDEETNVEMANSRVYPFDVLLNITGASIGRSCVVPPEIPEANVNQHVCILRPRQERIMSEYLSYFLVSAIGQHQVFSCEEGISREGLSFEDVAYFIIPSPTLEEQVSILDHLKSKTSNIDVLSRATTRTIDLLREHRIALIAAAVTGKINIGADQTPVRV